MAANAFLRFAQAKWWLFLGRRKIRRKQYGQALHYFQRVIVEEPGSATALAKAAFCLSCLGKDAEAIRTYNDALYIAPDYADVHARLAELHARSQRNQDAYESLHRALRMKPQLRQSAYWLALLGSWCLELNRWEEARDTYKRLSGSDGKNQNVWLGLGISLGNLERWQESLDVFRKMVTLNAENGKAWHGIGWACAHLGRDSEALVALRRAIELDPENGAAHYELGDIYYKMHSFREAVGRLQESIRLRPKDPAGHHALGMTYCELGEFALAVEPFLRALRIGPEYGEVYNRLGIVYTELRQHEKAAEAFQNAIRAFQNAIRLEPRSAEHQCGLATAQSQLQRWTEAIQSAREALRLKPDSADGHLCLGCVLHGIERFDEAAAEYRKSLELTPGQFVALANLGDAYLQMGMLHEAKNAFVNAGAIDMKDPKLHRLLGEVYVKLGSKDDACREHEILKVLDPTLAEELGKLLNGV
jgi:tetratricopeptide (TPR) repeat protein